MLLQTSVASDVWRLLEKLDFASANKLDAGNYVSSSQTEKRATLLAFAEKQVALSKRWAEIVADLRFIGLTR
jgi:hypothetical protein